jgi:hypothetical protein
MDSRACSSIASVLAPCCARLLRVAALALLIVLPAACSNCNLHVKTSALPNGVVGVSYEAGLHSGCGGGAWFIQTGSLPPGISLINNGFISGTPTVPGQYTFTVGVFDFDSGETAFAGLSILIEPAA